METAWRRTLYHNNFDTSVVKIDQVLLILWRLNDESTHFHCCTKSYCPYWLARYYGGWFESLITSCDDFLTLSNSFDFPMYGNEQMVIVTLHLHTLITQFGSILSWIRILASRIPIRQHRWFTENFTMLIDRATTFLHLTPLWRS